MPHPPRILVVDDDWKDNERYCQVLQSVGYEVLSAVDGDQALQMLHEQDFDVILLDMLLTFRSGAGHDFGGIELLRRIREHDTTVQVIAITGYGNRELAISAMAQGAVECGEGDHCPPIT